MFNPESTAVFSKSFNRRLKETVNAVILSEIKSGRAKD